ncbi:MAG: NAD(P)/FAD-dependent oxidoreductase [Deltaproteobacteria bacterium]|nr:NAD(P)/FAD-dependent oxidoreductase [Deltaproteobacteria bacterium]
MAIRLKQEGVHDFLIFERANDLGGTWRDNTYPGCACDVPSHLYSFSFAPNPDWTRAFSRQPEILAYLRTCAERFGVMPHLRFGHEVQHSAWDEANQRWRITTSQGEFTADVLVAGMGPLSEPRLPSVPGLERFRGPTFHSARWDTSFDPSGKRVAVVGTGASAIQFVPAIQPQVAKLLLFQRTPPWIVPRRDRTITSFERWLFRHVPGLQRAIRATLFTLRELLVFGFMRPKTMRLLQKIALRYLQKSIPDPALRARLTPPYTMGCKRVLISSDYLPALNQPNVEVLSASLSEVRERSVIASDGTEREVDAVIFGTGFHVTDPPLAPHVRGRDGRTLAEHWQKSPKAHVGTTVSGFPNLFLLLGPNTGLGHNSVVLMAEAQIEHVLGALRHMQRAGVTTVEPRPEAQAQFIAETDALLAPTVWNAGGCSSWYLDETGRNSTIWPGFITAFQRRVERFRPEEYLLDKRAEPTGV